MSGSGQEDGKPWSARLKIRKGYRRRLKGQTGRRPQYEPHEPRRYDLMLAAMAGGDWMDLQQLRLMLEPHGFTRNIMKGYLCRMFKKNGWTEKRPIPGARFITQDSDGYAPVGAHYRLTVAGQEAARTSIARLQAWRLING